MNASLINSDNTGSGVQQHHHNTILSEEVHQDRNNSNNNNDQEYDNDDESVNILNELENHNNRDENTILLLKQIFPNESSEQLWQFHLNRCTTTTIATTTTSGTIPTANVDMPVSIVSKNIIIPSSSILDDTSVVTTIADQQQQEEVGNRNDMDLQVDRLRLSTLDTDVQQHNINDGQWKHDPELMEQKVLIQHEYYYGKIDLQNYIYYTKVVHRDRSYGLGMTLVSDHGNDNNDSIKANLPLIRILDLLTTTTTAATTTSSHEHIIVGPASMAGICRNDILIGMDGITFIESYYYNNNMSNNNNIKKQETSLLQHVVSRLRSGSDPTVLHLLRETNTNKSSDAGSHHLSSNIEKQALESTKNHFDSDDDSSSVAPTINRDVSLQSDLSCSQTLSVADRLVDSNIATIDDMTITSKSNNSIHPFVIVMANSNLLSSKEQQLRVSRVLNNFDVRARQWDDLLAFYDPSNETLIHLSGVRKALSVRIVNIFDDKDETAYTVWVYDIESGAEWYAPVRYHRDFEDLRSAVLPLCTASIQQTPFPRARGSSMNLFRPSPRKGESNVQRETKCRQLEHFLRILCSMVYTEKLHPYIAEVAIHVQSFLGCDTHEEMMKSSTTGESLPLPKFVDLDISTNEKPKSNKEEETSLQLEETRNRLKRSLQCFIYRLFLLDGMSQLIERFIGRLRTQGPRLQDIEQLEGQGRDVLKARAMADLHQIQSFLDNVQNMILEGCMNDFVQIAERPEYATIQHLIVNNVGSTYWDTLVREAVREQVEVEVYVPLRSVVSRWLVNAWRHEDMEVYFRMKELRRRPTEFFRMKHSNIQQYDTTTVTAILNEGVGLSTLPCMKLRAIVAAARETYRMIRLPNDVTNGGQQDAISGTTTTISSLGADDFLPIFIYCIVQAEIERPCALCVLLQTLCDPIHKIGEIGYYLLSFEAAIKYCEDVDLTAEDR